MLQRCAHPRNRPTATDEKTRKVFPILVVISLVGTVSGKSLKMLPPDVIGPILKLQCTKFDFGWGSVPDTARGTYSDPPDLIPAGFEGPTCKGKEGTKWNGKGRGRKGVRRGEVGGGGRHSVV